MGNDAGAGGPNPGAFARLRSGFLFGLGFSVSFVGLSALALFIAYRLSQNAGSPSWHKSFTPKAGLAVVHQELQRTKHNLKVLGNVRNTGKDTWDFVRIEVDLFDAKGGFVGKCDGHTSGPVGPGRERYFVVDCAGSERDPVPDFSRYTVEVVDASYEMDDGT